jgi:hypothetical protein
MYRYRVVSTQTSFRFCFSLKQIHKRFLTPLLSINYLEHYEQLRPVRRERIAYSISLSRPLHPYLPLFLALSDCQYPAHSVGVAHLNQECDGIFDIHETDILQSVLESFEHRPSIQSAWNTMCRIKEMWAIKYEAGRVVVRFPDD